MLTPTQIEILLNRPRDTKRSPAGTVQQFLDLWIDLSRQQKSGLTPDYHTALAYCSLTWLEKPVLHNGFPLQYSFADNAVQGMMESYNMLSYEPVGEPELDSNATSCIISVIVRFSVPIYPDPEKDEFYMKEYRRKMNIRCIRETAPGVSSSSGEWNIDPNSVLDQECA